MGMRFDGEKNWWKIILLIAVIWAAILWWPGCAAAGGNQLSPELTAEIAKLTTIQENRTGPQAGPVVPGSGNWITNLNFSAVAGQGGLSIGVVLLYVFGWRWLARCKREKRARKLIQDELAKTSAS